MKYLLDTNICIYIIKQKPIEVFAKFQSLEIGSIGISSITLAELQYGVRKSAKVEKNLEALEKFISPMEIFDFDQEATHTYGIIRADLESRGLSIGPLDTLIAAHALSRNLTLVTNNEREFKRVNGLTVENWVK